LRHRLGRDGVNIIAVEADGIEARIDLIGNDDGCIDHIAQKIFRMRRRVDVDVQLRKQLAQLGQLRNQPLRPEIAATRQGAGDIRRPARQFLNRLGHRLQRRFDQP
jgi:hypothetical protein